MQFCKPYANDKFPLSYLLIEPQFYNSTSEQSESAYSAPNVDTYVQPPATFGNLIPEAFLKVENTNVSRYDDLEIIFSHSIDPSTLISNLGGTDTFILLDSSNNPVGGRIFWFGSKKIYFDPYKELKSLEIYTLVISSDVKTTGGIALKPYTRKFTTRPGFIFTLTLDGKKLADPTLTTVNAGVGNGVIFDSNDSPYIRLNIGVNNNIEISYLKLCKLAVGVENSSSSPTRCRTENIKPDIDLSDPGIFLCNGSCPSNTSIWLGDSGQSDGFPNLTQDYLKLKKGANNYFLEVSDTKGNITIKNISFYWAPTNPDPYTHDSVQFVLDKSNSTFPTNSAIPQVEYFVKKYARNLFTLLGKSFNEFLNDVSVMTNNLGAGSTPTSPVTSNPCMTWNRKNVLNTSNLNEPFSFHYLNRIGPFCNVKVSGKALSGATTYSITTSSLATAGQNEVSLSTGGSYSISDLSVDMLARNKFIPEHTIITTIITSENKIKLSQNITTNIPAGTIIEFDYSSFTATADVFVQSIYVDPNHLDTVNNPDGFNVDLSINPRKVGTNQYLEVNFSGRKASGRIAAIAKVDTLQPVIAQAAAPIGSTFAFFDDNPYDSTLYEKEGTAIGFNLNDSDPSFPKKNVYTTLHPVVNSPNILELVFEGTASNSPYYFRPFRSFPPFGNAGDSICYLQSNMYTGCGSSCPKPSLISTCNNTNPGPIFPTLGNNSLSLNPNTLEWSDSISVYNINITQGDDIITNILNSLAQVQIEKLKPKLLQLAVKDVLDRLVTELLKTIFKHIENGIDIPLFNSLPDPFKNLKLNLSARVLKVGTNETGTNTLNALEGEADISLKFEKDLNECPASSPCLWESNVTIPPTTQPINARPLLLKDAPTPSIYNYKADYGNDGLLLGIHPDVINQALESAWRIGALNLKIDNTFRTELISFASQNNTALIQLLNYVSTGRSIRTILAPTKDSIEGRDATNQPVLVDDDDEIIYQLNWLLPPVVKGAFTRAAAFEVPRMDLKVGDLEVFITGKKISGPYAGTTYTLAYLKVALNSRLDLDIVIKSPTSVSPWNLPVTQGWNDYRNSLRLSFSTDPRDIRYVIEPGEPGINVPDRNPIGQDPRLFVQVLEPLVKTFIIPMINDILYDITIEQSLEYCGLGLYNLQLVSQDVTNTDPSILIKTLLYDYNFTGDCNP